jgi:hypothetical protein
MRDHNSPWTALDVVRVSKRTHETVPGASSLTWGLFFFPKDVLIVSFYFCDRAVPHVARRAGARLALRHAAHAQRLARMRCGHRRGARVVAAGGRQRCALGQLLLRAGAAALPAVTRAVPPRARSRRDLATRLALHGGFRRRPRRPHDRLAYCRVRTEAAAACAGYSSLSSPPSRPLAATPPLRWVPARRARRARRVRWPKRPRRPRLVGWPGW